MCKSVVLHIYHFDSLHCTVSTIGTHWLQFCIGITEHRVLPKGKIYYDEFDQFEKFMVVDRNIYFVTVQLPAVLPASNYS
jgi:hypothetical protein